MVNELDKALEATPEQTPEQVQEIKPADSSKEYNLRLLRERTERAEQKLLETERYLEALKQQQYTQQSRPVEQAPQEQEFDIADDSLPEGRHYKQLAKEQRQLKKEFSSKLEQLEAERKQAAVENAALRLKTDLPDIYQVVSDKALEQLKSLKPFMYRSIMANQDPYDRGRAAYDAILSAGYHEQYESEEKRIAQNQLKPKAAATAGPKQSETPLTRLGDYDRRVLSEADRERIRRQVAEAKSYRT